MKTYIQKLNAKGNGAVIVGIIVLVIVVIVGYWYATTQRETPVPTFTPAPIVTESARVDTSDWKTYESRELGILFKYPVGMEILHDEPELKMIMAGPEQGDGPGFIDGLFLVVGETSI